MIGKNSTKIVCEQNFAEGSDSHLCASVSALCPDGARRYASPRIADIHGVTVTDGDINPDVVVIDFERLAADVQELRIHVHPYRSHYTFADADCAFCITVTIQVSDESVEVIEYRPKDRVFDGVDLITLRKQLDGQWKREILAGAALVEAGAA